MTVYLFPGQGSQTKGMGGILFDEFSDLTAKTDAILGYSIKNLCLEDPQEQLNKTEYTQPALYVVNALTYYKKIQENRKFPNFVIGHSLGEYNALLAADVFDFATGLKLVKKRGELMSAAQDGAMAAVIGLKVNALKNIINQSNFTNVGIANYNSHTQLVITGLKTEVAEVIKICQQNGASFIVPLKVSGAFHSPFMQKAQDQFAVFLREFQFSPPKIQIIANYTAKPYKSSDLYKNITQQITNSVRFSESIEYLFTVGEKDSFEEIGPSKVLTGLIKNIKNGQ